MVNDRVEKLNGGSALDLSALMREAAKSVKLRWTPEAALVGSRLANAFATLVPYRVTLLTGVLEVLTPSEIEAMLVKRAIINAPTKA